MMKTADLIITNAQVYTVDEANPWAEAVAVRAGRIVFVGSAAEAVAWQGADTRVIDGQGGSLLPGFIDSHLHLLSGSLGLADIQLAGVGTLAALAEAVRVYGAANPQMAWLQGSGLRYGVLPDDGARLVLDGMEGERPLVLTAYDGHTAWLNTVALERAGMLQGVADPTVGVLMGADGLATGELREAEAGVLLEAAMPKPDDYDKRAALRQGLAYLASLGVTSVHNMDGDAAQAGLYAALEDAGELTLRVYVPYSIRPETPLAALATEAVALREQFNSEMVRGGCVKFFMDGVLESYTAVMLQGYPDQPDNFGEPIYPTEHFAAMVAEADRLGLQIFTHACGDGAVRRVLDGYEWAQGVNGRRRDRRHRVEHIELIDMADLPRFAELGVIASVQPLHAPNVGDEDVWRERVTEADWDRSFAWRTLREAGAIMAFGSDWSVASPDPMAGIHAALTRQPWGEGYVAQAQTLAETIASYTRDGAYAEFQEEVKGQIRVGMYADLVLLTADIFVTDPEEMLGVRVAVTVCNGRVVYERR
ncbi:MAG: amidohydrolase [Ardenticatenaceae bacterium]|nr:amidohydrolase [Ardenticatenaceae bacterium]